MLHCSLLTSCVCLILKIEAHNLTHCTFKRVFVFVWQCTHFKSEISYSRLFTFTFNIKSRNSQLGLPGLTLLHCYALDHCLTELFHTCGDHLLKSYLSYTVHPVWMYAPTNIVVRFQSSLQFYRAKTRQKNKMCYCCSAFRVNM